MLNHKLKQKPTPSPIALQLARLMRERAITPTELSRRTNIPQPTIHRLLNTDNNDPRISTLYTLANYFAVPTDYFLGNLDQQTLHNTRAVSVYNLSNIHYPLTELAPTEHNLILSGLGPNCFAIHSTTSMSPRIPPQSLLVIDPEQTPQDGDLVLVYYKETGHFSVQDLLQDGTRQRLGSLNTSVKEDLNPATMVIVGTGVQITTLL